MQKTYALFDFDGTIIKGDSIILLVRYAWQKKLLGLRGIARIAWATVLYGLKLCTPVHAKERTLAFLTGKTNAEVTAIATDFVKTVLLPRLRPEAMAELKRHRDAGHEILLVSASSTFYLKHLRQALGYTGLIATRMDVDETGVFSGYVSGDNCRGVQKPLRLAEYLAAKGDRLDYRTSSAYGDTYGDLPMLRLCAHKYAVNPRRRLWRALRPLDGATRIHWREPA